MMRARYVIVGVAAAALIAFVGYRKLRPGTTTAKKAAHGHAHAPGDRGHAGGKEEHHHAGHKHGSREQGEGFIKFTAAQIETTGLEIRAGGRRYADQGDRRSGPHCDQCGPAG
jgi:ABC-type nickel/cobalt efflux system permease component RcnA